MSDSRDSVSWLRRRSFRRRAWLALGWLVFSASLYFSITAPILDSAARGSTEWMAAWLQVGVMGLGAVLFVLPVLAPFLARCVLALALLPLVVAVVVGRWVRRFGGGRGA
jgi:hypothetical protein